MNLGKFAFAFLSVTILKCALFGLSPDRAFQLVSPQPRVFSDKLLFEIRIERKDTSAADPVIVETNLNDLRLYEYFDSKTYNLKLPIRQGSNTLSIKIHRDNFRGDVIWSREFNFEGKLPKNFLWIRTEQILSGGFRLLYPNGVQDIEAESGSLNFQYLNFGKDPDKEAKKLETPYFAYSFKTLTDSGKANPIWYENIVIEKPPEGLFRVDLIASRERSRNIFIRSSFNGVYREEYLKDYLNTPNGRSAKIIAWLKILPNGESGYYVPQTETAKQAMWPKWILKRKANLKIDRTYHLFGVCGPYVEEKITLD